MSNGASGCGFEYSDDRCRHLHTTDMAVTFTCSKYCSSLKTQRTTGHPFRDKECTEQAWRDVESKLAAQRKARNIYVKQMQGKHKDEKYYL